MALALAAAFAGALPAPASEGGAGLPGQRGVIGHASPGYLGVDLREVSEERVATLKLKDTHGAEIVRVDHDGPAGKMNLREHDVIVQMNGVAIENLEQIKRLLHEMPPGRTVSLLISRDGQQVAASSQMADRSELERIAWEQHLGTPGPVQAPLSDPAGEAAVPPPALNPSAPAPTSRYGRSFLGNLLTSPTYTGLVLEKMGAQLAGFFGVPDGAGLLVRHVEDNSPAAMAGMHAGDVVIRADQQTVATPAAWARTIREAKGRPVSVIVVRDRQEKTLTLTPDVKHRSALELHLPETPEPATVARLTES